MILPICVYSNDPAVQMIWEQLKTLSDGKIDANNLDTTGGPLGKGILGKGLSWAGPGGGGKPPAPQPPPPLNPDPDPPVNQPPTWWPWTISNPIADPDTNAFLRKKGSSATAEGYEPGLELVVQSADATYGRICIVASEDLTKQIASFIPENPGTTATPKMTFYANYGKMQVGTNTNADWELHRNGAKSLSSDGTKLDTTDTQFRLGGTTVSFPMWKRSTTRLQAKLADDSAFTGIDSSNLDLYGDQTTFRIRLNPGTPSANTSITLPNRNVALVGAPATLTVNVLPRADVNGDLVDSALSDDGSTVGISRATILGSTALTISSGNHASGLTVKGGEGVGSGRPATFRGGDGAIDNNGGAATFRGGDAGTQVVGAPNGGAATSRAGDATGAGTGGAYVTRAGTSPSGTKGVWDLQHADGTTRLKIDASGNTLFKGVQGTVSKVAKFDSTGAPVDSAITENGTSITLGRATVDLLQTTTFTAGTTGFSVTHKAGTNPAGTAGNFTIQATAGIVSGNDGQIYLKDVAGVSRLALESAGAASLRLGNSAGTHYFTIDDTNGLVSSASGKSNFQDNHSIPVSAPSVAADGRIWMLKAGGDDFKWSVNGNTYIAERTSRKDANSGYLGLDANGYPSKQMGASDTNVLTWSSANSRWQPATAASSGITIGMAIALANFAVL